MRKLHSTSVVGDLFIFSSGCRQRHEKLVIATPTPAPFQATAAVLFTRKYGTEACSLPSCVTSTPCPQSSRFKWSPGDVLHAHLLKAKYHYVIQLANQLANCFASWFAMDSVIEFDFNCARPLACSRRSSCILPT